MHFRVVPAAATRWQKTHRKIYSLILVNSCIVLLILNLPGVSGWFVDVCVLISLYNVLPLFCFVLF